MLELLRRIFGCVHDPSLDAEYPVNSDQLLEMIDLIKDNDEHTLVVDNKSDLFKKDEKKEIIGNIVSAVIAEKQKGFISYTEEAQDSVTGGKFKFIKYRP